MKIEHEIKFSPINIKEISTKIENLGGIKVMDRFLYKRFICDINDHAFIRLRTTPKGASITIKECNDGNWQNHLLEQEMFINSFDEGKLFIEWFIKNKLIADPNLRYQENIRTMYKINDIELCIDEWPLIAPFLEIETPDQKSLEEIVKQLDFDFTKGLTGSVNNLAIKLYNIDLASYKFLTFERQEKL